jgi:hypothetical protein
MVANNLSQPAASRFSPGDGSSRFVYRVYKHVPNYVELHSRYVIAVLILANVGTAVAQWLRFCATNRKVAGSIPDGVIGFFR